MRRVTLGRIAGVYGVRGAVRLQSYTRPIENLIEYSDCWIAHGEGFSSRLVSPRRHGAGLVSELLGADGELIRDRDVAASLIGAEVQVDRDQLPDAPEGEFYWIDLIGLEVVGVGGEPLGKVESLTSNGAQDILVIRDAERERMIPFVQGPIIESVDLEQGRIIANWQADF